MTTDTAKRTRNAAATRAAILASARQAFARAGYDGAGVREIAADAGVTAMLINRYFGSKEQLFAEVVADTMRDPVILRPENVTAADLAARMARGLVAVTQPGETPLDGFRIMALSAANPRAAEISRAEIAKHHLGTMTGALSGAGAGERAAIALSLVAGLQVMRQMIGLTPLAEADPDVLARLLEPLFEQLIGPRA